MFSNESLDQQLSSSIYIENGDGWSSTWAIEKNDPTEERIDAINSPANENLKHEGGATGEIAE